MNESPQSTPASPQRLRHTEALVLLLTVLAAGLLALLFLCKPAIDGAVRRLRDRQHNIATACVSRGMQSANAGIHDVAFRYFQVALSMAKDEPERQKAAFAMADFLLDQAIGKGDRFKALMAEEYYRAILDLKISDGARFRAWRGILRTAAIRGDYEAVTAAARRAYALAPDEALRADVLIAAMDTALAIGTWEDVQHLLKLAPTNDAMLEYELAPRRAAAKSRILRDNAWFDAWRRSVGRQVDPAAARSALVQETLADYNRLRQSPVKHVVDNAIYSSASLLAHEGRRLEARPLLMEFVNRDPVRHMADALLLLTSIEHERGRMEESQEILRRLLVRYQWNQAGADELLSIVNLCAENGQGPLALRMVERFLDYPKATLHRPALLSVAGRLSRDAGDLKNAEKRYTELSTLEAGDTLSVEALLQLADIRSGQGDLEGARKFLIKYLNRYPGDRYYGDALFRLLKLAITDHNATAEAITSAAAFVNRRPEDPRILDAMVTVAARMESLGLSDRAEALYSRVNTLSTQRRMAKGATNAALTAEFGTVAARASLGLARCLLVRGDAAGADQLLRELHGRMQPGPLQAEVACLWAEIAASAGQRTEALRRIELVGPEASPLTAATAGLQRLLLDIKHPAFDVDAMIRNLDKIEAVLPTNESPRVVKAYVECWKRLEKDGRLSDMERFAAHAARGRLAAALPLEDMRIGVAAAALRVEGVDALPSRLSRDAVNTQAVNTATAELGPLAAAIKDARSAAKPHL